MEKTKAKGRKGREKRILEIPHLALQKSLLILLLIINFNLICSPLNNALHESM